MATNFPTSLDNATNLPSTPDPFVANITTGHLSHPPTANGAIRALEAKVGIGSSAPPSANARYLVTDGAGSTTWGPPRVHFSTQAGTAYTFGLGDLGYSIESTSASATSFTVPPFASVAWPDGSLIDVCQIGAGILTIVAGAGVTIRTSSTLQLRAQYSCATLRYRTSNEWVLSGDVA